MSSPPSETLRLTASLMRNRNGCDLAGLTISHLDVFEWLN